MAWITVEAAVEGRSVCFNTRNILAVADPPCGEEGNCGVIMVGDHDNAVAVKGPREALVRKIIQAERSERHIRAEVQRLS